MNRLPSSPRVLSLANQKGGVGKTTTAINLGTALAAIGEEVLIVDLDPQGNASTGLGIDRKSRKVSTYDILIGEAELACLRPDALLVNTSRAELLAPGALLASLAKGRPGAAALDVFPDEPDGVAPYLDSPQVLCTPHLGFVERDTYEAYFREAFAHVRALLLDDCEKRNNPTN